MVDADTSLEFQLNKLQLSKVTSTDEVIGRGAYGRVIKVHVHGTLCAAKEINSSAFGRKCQFTRIRDHKKIVLRGMHQS